MTSRARRRYAVEGVVQGVGFRPFVQHLADSCRLAGFVRNDLTRVHIEVEGTAEAVAEFGRRLTSEAPPMARIDVVIDQSAELRFDDAFFIAPSGSSSAGDVPSFVPPDTATCSDCVSELFDPTDRRYRHPFITCTNCGPRFTIIDRMPYDRPNTSMATFPMCAACRSEYLDSGDRRHHAQPIACPDCGPLLRYSRGTGEAVTGEDALGATVDDLAAGRIVAIKGLGGYHLAADASDDAALGTLRRRKHRPDKPFAIMVRDLDAVGRLAHVGDAETVALTSSARPIVLLRARPDSGLSDLVAPGNPLVGVMLPYTPLHHLLFAPEPGSNAAVGPEVLVMTSGNIAEEPICFDDGDARRRLGSIADSFCDHDRPIRRPCDDSIVRVVDGHELPIRRSRGFAPLPVRLPVAVPPMLAAGGDLKNTVAVAAGRDAWLSQHLGDMATVASADAFDATVADIIEFTRIDPEVVVVDAHPGYHSRRRAERLIDTDTLDVQHHHAHLAALMAEHQLDGTEPVIGVVFDGTGHGRDGSSWGGEILIGDYADFERWGHLAGIPLPGGDSAARNPCRSALAHLRADGIAWSPELAPVRACTSAELELLDAQLDKRLNCVTSSSMGRLFDAVASILDIRHRVGYEAQAAIGLEILAATATEPVPMAFAIGNAGTDGVEIDPAPVLRALLDGRTSGHPSAELALGFHVAVVDLVTRCAQRIRAARGLDVVGLSGGVFQNELLAGRTAAALRHSGFTVLTHRLVPPNDGGIALGQIMVGAHRRLRGHPIDADERGEPLCV